MAGSISVPAAFDPWPETLLAGSHAVRGRAVRVPLAELGRACVAAAVASLGGEKLGPLLGKEEKRAAAAAKLSDSVAASQAITKKAKGLLITARGYIGTHTAKIPDNRLPDGAVQADPEVLRAAAGAVRGVATGSFAAERPLSGSGNGANNPEMRFLAWPLRVDGGPATCIAELLACGTEAEREAMLSPFDEAARQVLREAGRAYAAYRGPSGIPARVPPGQRTILWPTGEGAYVAVSPLASFALMAELERRIGERSRRPAPESGDQRRQRFDTTRIAVGGTKPQNTALVASDVGGEFRRLLALPPRPERRDATALLRRLGRAPIRFSGRDVRASTLAFLADALADQRGNLAARQRQDAALEQVAEDVLSLLVRLAEAATDAGHESPAVHPENRALATLAGFTGQEATDADIGALANAATRAALARLDGLKFGPKGKQQALRVGDLAFENLRVRCRRVLEEYAR